MICPLVEIGLTDLSKLPPTPPAPKPPCHVEFMISSPVLIGAAALLLLSAVFFGNRSENLRSNDRSTLKFFHFTNRREVCLHGFCIQ